MSVQYYCAASLDGYIAGADDSLDWLTGYRPAAPPGEDVTPVEGGYEDFYAEVGALVTGSVTYEWVLEHLEEWPYAGKPCWVLSSRELPLPDADDVDVRLCNASIPELFDEMVSSAGDRHLWVLGGGNVASQFADAGLLDELMVTVVPVVLGAGKPLFDRRLPGAPMRLVGVLPRATGMVELRYELLKER